MQAAYEPLAAASPILCTIMVENALIALDRSLNLSEK
jgi:hypothetical protein